MQRVLGIVWSVIVVACVVGCASKDSNRFEWLGDGTYNDLPSNHDAGRSERQDAANERSHDSGRQSLDSGDESHAVGSNPILGAWWHTIGDCRYTHTFDASGSYTIDSTTGERVEATYTVTAPPSPDGRWRLDFTVDYDNNVVDCEGDRINETGMSHTAFIDVVERDRLDIYRTATGGSAAFSFFRAAGSSF